MNSLNLLSARVIGPSPSQASSIGTTSRSRSLSESIRNKGSLPTAPKRSVSQHKDAALASGCGENGVRALGHSSDNKTQTKDEQVDEKTPLLDSSDGKSTIERKQNTNRLRTIAKRLANALKESLKWVLWKLTSTGVYFTAFFYDSEGRFSPFMPIRRMRPKRSTANGTGSTAHTVGLSRLTSPSSRATRAVLEKRATRGSALIVPEKEDNSGTTSTPTSDSEKETHTMSGNRSRDLRQKARSRQSSEDVSPPRQSIRIKLNNEDIKRRRKPKLSGQSASEAASSIEASQEVIAAANLKSPTSPAAVLRMTKYPHAPAPPRPLIPRRQASYSTFSQPPHLSAWGQKTLVIDLDETLIHSLSKGGRMSSGHMVEVKLSHSTSLDGLTLGPQHPILYYVHKRPYCDEFLRKVCKWFNLVVFTASVQEYADPVIDWLEQERKYFSARYYRQHCTFRNGAYIKDLSFVEPDLSRVMILDNSPLSYIFHEGRVSWRIKITLLSMKVLTSG